jgi:hypothetical protein
MAIPTLNALHDMQQTMRQLEQKAERATLKAATLRACGNQKSILEWHRGRTSYGSQDYDGITKLLEDAMAEFGPAILEILAARQELIAHEAMTQAVLKRAELGTFVSLAEDGSAA